MPTPSARQIAAETLVRQFSEDGSLSIADPLTSGLSDVDARLALAIVRLCQQRWLTLEHLLNAHLKAPHNMGGIEPMLRAVLLSGAAQLLFMDRLPAYAVVNEQVQLAGRLVRPGSTGLVNAVLRRLSGLVHGRSETPWKPGRRLLPLAPGTLELNADLLPDPAAHPEPYLSIATSHPVFLVRRWLKQFGRPAAARLLECSLRTPPTVIHAPEAASLPPQLIRHQEPGFYILEGSRAEIAGVLAQSPTSRVQDTSAAKAVRLLADRRPKRLLDYCAGQGTKTRQLAGLLPESEITAWDIQQDRQKSLNDLAGNFSNVRVLEIAIAKKKYFDALLLDVPCSNSGVFSRRPEARYRFNEAGLKELVELQRAIISQSLPFLKTGGLLLYSTCSLESCENQEQIRWVCGEFRFKVLTEQALLPEGTGTTYRDGAYAALLQSV